MSTPLNTPLATDFLKCTSEMRMNLSRWKMLTREFAENVEATRQAINRGCEKWIIVIKLKTVAGIIVAMHRWPADKKGRMAACDALLQLDTFAVAHVSCRVVNLFRLDKIIAIDAQDRMKRAPRRMSVKLQMGVPV